MQDAVFYIERREVTEVSHDRAGWAVKPPDPDLGLGVTWSEGGSLVHRWWVPTASAPLSVLPGSALARARAVLAGEEMTCGRLEEYEALARELVERARQLGAEHLETLVQQVSQRVLCGPGDALVEDWRRFAFVEMRAHVGSGEKSWSIWRCAMRHDAAELGAALPSLLQTLDGMVALLQEKGPPVPCPEAELPIVFPPGAASGCFFHEVCGHPLEGDVVGHAGSYLSRRLGQQVASEIVTVADSPVGMESSLSYGVDDEGVPARRVALVKAGVVGEPLLDRLAARHLGFAPNGHGRRVGFRHIAIPRMGHTLVEPYQGTLEGIVQEVGAGLLVRHLTPRHMDLLSGDFSFFINEAQVIQDGKLGSLVGPGILRGNGLEALRSIDAVGADAQNLFSTRGCRKLDHGPLPVSFGQPTIRFQRLRVEPWR